MIEVKTRPHGGRYYKPRETPTPTHTWLHLQEMQLWPLKSKIDYAHEKIQRALERMTLPCLAFSAGKDSTVLLHLLRQHKPDIAVIYGNTTIEFPECVQFARWLRKEWNLNFYEARPQVTFWWVVENYGWPLLGKEFGVGGVAHKTSREKFFAELEERGELTGQYAIQAEVPISSACCAYLKEKPAKKVQRELGIDGVFLGILAGESRRRTFNFLHYGDLYYPKNEKLWKCHPLSIWTDEDIWAYIREFRVPYASLYDTGFYHETTGEWISHKRNGCMFCGMDIKFANNHLSIMRRTHPKAWRTVMIHKGLGKVLLKLRFALDDHQLDLFEESYDLKEYLTTFPCVFDRV
jgi:3'-phosphoadenosine 5'-phosphosulfate sulfotransferase (PAPS reductase)/FAD synthetase